MESQAVGVSLPTELNFPDTDKLCVHECVYIIYKRSQIKILRLSWPVAQKKKGKRKNEHRKRKESEKEIWETHGQSTFTNNVLGYRSWSG